MATSGKSEGRFDAATRSAAGSVGMRGRKVASGVQGAAGGVRRASAGAAERGRAAGGQATDRVRKGTAAAKPGGAAGGQVTARVRKGSPDTAQGRRAAGDHAS